VSEVSADPSDPGRHEPDHDGDPDRDGLRSAAPGLLRLSAGAWMRTAGWWVNTSLRAGSLAVRAALDEDARSEISGEVREHARRFLGIDLPGSGKERTEHDTLRERGAELLRRSADVDYEEDLHPAYARILSELAPDEARILRLLAASGPQPAIDIRAGLPLVSDLVKGGLNMIGAEAGLRYTDRVHAYLNNLNRLGLVWFSRERLRDPQRYQVLEAQPEVIAAMKKGGRTARTVRRSILLTPFGRDFCEMALPADTAELESVTNGD
jgi:Abortive infection alpha